VERIARLKLEEGSFPVLVREALEAEYGGEGDALLKEITFSDPESFASQAYKSFGSQAMEYYEAVLKYADSGRFHPEQEAEEEREEKELETIIDETESPPDVDFNPEE
jgi:hypothetical protein